MTVIARKLEELWFQVSQNQSAQVSTARFFDNFVRCLQPGQHTCGYNCTTVATRHEFGDVSPNAVIAAACGIAHFEGCIVDGGTLSSSVGGFPFAAPGKCTPGYGGFLLVSNITKTTVTVECWNPEDSRSKQSAECNQVVASLSTGLSLTVPNGKFKPLAKYGGKEWKVTCTQKKDTLAPSRSQNQNQNQSQN